MVCPTTRGRADYTTLNTEMQAYIRIERKNSVKKLRPEGRNDVELTVQ